LILDSLPRYLGGMSETFLLPAEVDQQFRWPIGRAERLARRGKLPHVRAPDGSIRFRESDLDPLVVPFDCSADANRRVQAFRAILLRAVTNQDMREIAKKLVAQAKSGDLSAVRELLDRAIGRPVQLEVLVRLEALEDAMHAQEAQEAQQAHARIYDE
jgi:hypothetical protein